MHPSAYPLDWPEHIDRSCKRESGQFRTSLAGALKNVNTSITAFARDSRKSVGNIVISSNVTLGSARPDDPGVAVWFVWDGMSVCFPVDRYQTVEANLQAIHHIIEARRTELRHGTLALVQASFKGFQALPSPGNAHSSKWWVVLGVSENATTSQVNAAYRKLAAERHPDRGGSTAAMAELNAARDKGLKVAGA